MATKKIIPSKTRRAAKPAKKARTALASKKPKTTGRKATTAMSRIHEVPPAPAEIKRVDPAAIDLRFQKAAEKLDAKIVDKVRSIGVDFVELGGMFNEAKAKGYNVALGFPVWSDYVEARTGKSKTQVYQAMSVERELTSGDNPIVSKADVLQMPQETAETIVRLKKDNVTITPEIIEQAKTMSVTKFQSQVAYPASPRLATRAAANAGAPAARSNTNADGTKIAEVPSADAQPESESSPLAAAGEVFIKQVWTLRSDTVADLKRSEAIARYVTRDADQSIPWQDRFLQSMCAEFIATWEAAYEEHRDDANAEGHFAATRTKEMMALSDDDLEEEITVTNERRVEMDGDSSDVVNEAEFANS